MKKILPDFIFVGILLILSLLSHTAWLNPFSVLTNGDVWYLYKEAMLISNWGTWTSFLSLGELNVSYNLFFLTLIWRFVAQLGGDYQIANQIVYFLPIIVLAPISIYCFLKLETKSPLASFIGSIFYIFSTTVLVLENGGLLQAGAYILLPLVFYFYEKYLHKEKYSDGLFFVLTLSLLIWYENRITYIFLFILLAYAISFFVYRYKYRFVIPLVLFIKKSLFLGILLLLINAYVYLPLVLSDSIQVSAGQVTSRGLFGAVFYSLKNPLAFMHPFWSGKVPTEFIPMAIPLYFWLFPLFAFSALFFSKRNKKIIFFAGVALVVIFLGKSESDPFGEIYRWLYFNFPGFSFFREPSKFWPFIGLSYAVLIAYTIQYTCEKLPQKGKLATSLKILVCVPIVAASLYTAKPAFTRELGPLFNNLVVSNEHNTFKNFLVAQQDFFRTYYLPGRYRMGYWSEIHPMLGLNEVPEFFQSLDPRLLGMLSVKYIVIPPDITNDVYRIWGSKEVYLRALQQATDFIPVKKPFGTFIVYENTKQYNPHIYTSDNLTYIVGDKSKLLDIFSLVQSAYPTLYFETGNYVGENKSIQQQLEKEKQVNYENSNEVILIGECIRCEDKDYRFGLVYPFPRFLPNSVFYDYIIGKEQKNLMSLSASPLEKIQQEVFYSVKRMVEVQKMADRGITQEYITTSLREHKKLLDMLEKDLSYFESNVVDNKTTISIYDYIDIQRDIASVYLTSNKLNARNQEMLKDTYGRVLKALSKITNTLWISDDTTNKYTLSVPYSGEYEIMLKTDAPFVPLQLDEQQILQTQSSSYEDWKSAGVVHLEQGLHTFTTPKDIMYEFIPNKTLTIEKGVGQEVIRLPMQEIEDNTEYIVSYTYKVNKGGNVRYYIDRDSDFSQNRIIKKTSDQFLKNDAQWHEMLNNRFYSRFGEKKASLTFVVDKNLKQETGLTLENIRVIKNKSPLLVAKQNKKVKTSLSMPQLSFQWVNPTKYHVSIKNAAHPFYLIFAESYDQGWSAYYGDSRQLSGTIAKNHTTHKVTEYKGQNTLDLFSFSTDATRVKESRHFQANAFANGWYIDKKGDYTLTIAFDPQENFKKSFAISFTALLIAIGTLVYLKLHEK